MDLLQCTAHEIRDLLRKKEVSSKELTEAALDRIDKVDGTLKAFLHISRESALTWAEEVDKRFSEGQEMSDLAGIPMALKDNMCTEGLPTTCASKILQNFVPPYNATVTEKLYQQKAILMGKTNMDEFAMGSSTENSAFSKTKNPWDIQRVPGGSSGGSAAAVAAGEVFYALGSDTGGSIRQPASFCGLIGLKPTYGLVSRYGLIAYASSLDQIGPLTKDVEDCALVLNGIAGHDSMDSTSAEGKAVDYRKALICDVKGLKIGIAKEYFGEGIEEGVKKSVYAAIELLKSLGATYEEVSLPHTQYALPTYYIIASSECSSNLARFDGIRYGYRTESFDNLTDLFVKTRSEGFGEEVKRRIMLGTYALSSGYYDAYYKKALQVRTLIKQDFDKAFEKFDVLIAPTTPTPAFRLGEKTDDPLQMYMSDVCTVPINIAGIPAISVPCGFIEGMPIGMQIMGKHFDESTLLRVAYTLEQHTAYHKERPVL
ncbi:Asp-tRNA(Asn)/Glu-tRNA(Gln) amidotransferase subunit GatA [Geosporobacter ferrireducens]|uniref:Glutamyl-tRNA(Gln) amidotransferase subunit A n=1 Tax=Geosporobacter ferrireducens TaxID=1424294 RepID=A0A1D8GFV4_9FIRM|nr:Asp-tRNA(Asn)/Glu-tRNA(Gln) amidotransferase subunit GatA [Geosporobacter ferrireducens]AOT69797.1 aspartyl/glutamyl-tRNA amidotransferase subunit A [Geosporobacter ferrireducens]MTI54487.1 Asp-tRNA(Asn)/Glu-tRNA(Gln) amidotransferase subunit GatA [Geosporobacter ferrireducens]